MTLPVIAQPIFEVNLTSRGKTKFRPFVVREQKILMQAVESKEVTSMVSAIKQVASACLVDKVDIDALPMCDLELLFLNLRARSMGEMMDVYYKCENMVKDKKCGMVLEIPVNLLNIKIKEEKNLDNKIALSKEIGVGLHYPSFDLLGLLNNKKNDVDSEFIVAAGCIDYIYDKDNVYKASDCKPEELIQFVMNLPSDKYDLIRNFILKTPKVSEVVQKQCPKCQYDHTFTLEGLYDFFI